jgi:hypothetical protein
MNLRRSGFTLRFYELFDRQASPSNQSTQSSASNLRMIWNRERRGMPCPDENDVAACLPNDFPTQLHERLGDPAAAPDGKLGQASISIS